jgi:hypothetical protein
MELGINSKKPTHRGSKGSRPNQKQISNDTKTPPHMQFALWNARSIRNKTISCSEYVLANNIDCLIITETWLKKSEPVVIGELTPPGYSFLSVPRDSDNYGGGIGVLFKSELKLQTIETGQSFRTIEHCCVTNSSKNVYYFLIYSPHSSSGNDMTTNEFLAEFDLFVDFVNSLGTKTVITGDFNIHAECPEKPEVVHFMTTLETAGFYQHVIGPTHISGSTLDLVFSRTDENLIMDCVVDPRLSDHHVVCFKICQQKSQLQKQVIVSRKLNSMDVPSFEADFHSLLESSDPPAEDLADHYNRAVCTTLDKHAPEVRSTRSTRLHHPWYNNSIHEARRVRRKHERKWRKSRLEVDHQLYAVQREHVNSLICVAKQEYYKNELAQADTKTVFKKVDSLLNRNTKTLPGHVSPQDLGNKFASYFSDKVSNIYERLENEVVELCNETSTNVDPESSVSCSLTNFDVLSEKDILEYIQGSPAKSCSLDPVPTWFIKQHPDTFVQIITKVTNDSLMNGTFPPCLKQAIVTPPP